MIKPGEIETLYIDLQNKPGLRIYSHMYYCISSNNYKKLLVCTSNPNKLIQSGILQPNGYITFKPESNLPFKKTTAIITEQVFEIGNVTFYDSPFKTCSSIISILLNKINKPVYYRLDETKQLLINPRKLRI